MTNQENVMCLFEVRARKDISRELLREAFPAIYGVGARRIRIVSLLGAILFLVLFFALLQYADSRNNPLVAVLFLFLFFMGYLFIGNTLYRSMTSHDFTNNEFFFYADHFECATPSERHVLNYGKVTHLIETEHTVIALTPQVPCVISKEEVNYVRGNSRDLIEFLIQRCQKTPIRRN